MKSALPQFKSRCLRPFLIDGEPWFVAADAAEMLEHATAKDLTRSLDDDEKGRHSVPTLGGDQEMAVISKPGLYKAF